MSQYCDQLTVKIVLGAREIAGERITGYPTTLMFQNGDLFRTFVGADTNDLVQTTKALLKKGGKAPANDDRAGYVYYVHDPDHTRRYIGQTMDKGGVEARWRREAGEQGDTEH